MDQEKIGKFIKSIRLEHNLTQKEFADKFGVTYQAVSKWENGKSIPDIAILKEICDDYNINIDDILNGEKNNNKNNNKKTILLIPIIIVFLILILIMLLINKKNDSFEFKIISSKCVDFKITGSAAYNKDKTSIYISNVEFCGTNSNENYKKINCTLYENYNDTKKEISKCKEKSNIKLEDYLEDVNIKVDNYNSTCKKLTSSILSLEIVAINENNKSILYTIPITLNTILS